MDSFLLSHDYFSYGLFLLPVCSAKYFFLWKGRVYLSQTIVNTELLNVSWKALTWKLFI